MKRWCAAVVVLILGMCTLCLGGPNYIVRVESFETLKGEEETLFEYNLKIIGRERMLNGTMVYHVDMDEQYEVWIEIDVLKDAEWIPMNWKIHTKPCHFMKNLFGKYYQSSFVDTNFPTGDDMCPLPKGEYYARNVVMSAENWPNFTTNGLNRCRIAFLKDGKLVGGFFVVGNIFRPST